MFTIAFFAVGLVSQFGKPLTVPFDLDGQLLILQREAIMPSNVGREVVLKRGSRTKKIHTLDDLRGKVTIKSPDEALAFVRLSTSLATCSLIGQVAGLEIIIPDDLTEDFFYHLSDMTSYRGTDGCYGIASKAWFAVHGISRASVSLSGQTWVVDRWLWLPGKGKFQTIFNVREKVGPRGQYSSSTIRKKSIPERFWMPGNM